MKRPVDEQRELRILGRCNVWSGLPFGQPLILVMGTDPDPDEVRTILNGKGAIVESNSGRPELADPLEVQCVDSS